MYFDGLFRRIGTVDPQPLAHAIGALGEDAWSEYVDRQEKYRPHRHTQTIPLLYDDDGRHTEPTAWPRFTELRPVLEPVLDNIRDAHLRTAGTGDDGYFIRIILTRLAPGADIRGHRDAGSSILRSHRNHLAITTNPLVEFEVGGETRHFAAGEIWEINNRQYHAVRNLSEEPRIHLIIDYVVPGEKIDDPQGAVIA